MSRKENGTRVKMDHQCVWTAHAAIAFLVLALLVPRLLQSRDAASYKPLTLMHNETNLLPRGFREGFVPVHHDESTLSRVADHRGPVSPRLLHLYYVTNFNPGSCSSNVVLVHATGFNANGWFGTAERAPVLATPTDSFNQSIASRFTRAGHCVTAFDLRGHGRSDVTSGPYTVPLFAADIAQALEVLFGEGHRYHLVGMSLGFGTALSIAMNYGNRVITVSGNGFLTDMTKNAGLAAYLFSRQWLIHAMGMSALGTMAEGAIQCNPSGLLSEAFSHMSVEGYYLTAQSWLPFNEREKLGKIEAAVLYMHPALDVQAGYTPENLGEDVALIKEAKLVLFHEDDGQGGQFDHCMVLVRPEKFLAPVLSWINDHRV